MMKRSASSLTIFSLLLVLFSVPLLAQEAKDERNRERDQETSMEKIRQRVQMPLAVDKAVKAGAQKMHVRTMARELVEGGVEGKDFNETMRYGPAISQSMNSEESDVEKGKGLGEFVRQKKNEGLRGKELAGAIHAELNRRGIPAGKKGTNGSIKNPVDGDFIPPGQQKKMDRDRSIKDRGQNGEVRGKSNRSEKVKSRRGKSGVSNRSGRSNNHGKGRK